MPIIATATAVSDFSDIDLIGGFISTTSSSRIPAGVAEGVFILPSTSKTAKILMEPITDFWVSFYYYFNSLSNNRPMFSLLSGGRELVYFQANGTSSSAVFRLGRTTAAGERAFYENTDVPRGGTSVINKYDVHVVTDEVNGLIEVFQNGALVATVSGNTAHGTTAGIDMINFNSLRFSSSSLTYVVSAVIVADEDTRSFEMTQLNLDSPGADTDFTGDFNSVVGTGLDDNTVMTTSVSGTQTFQAAPLTATALDGLTVVALAGSCRARVGGTAPSPVVPIIKTGSATSDGSVVAPDLVLNPRPVISSVNPTTGLPWDVASINSAEFGIQVG